MKAACTLLLMFLAILPAGAEELAPGPCLDKRKEIVVFLDKARKAGIGVKPYELAMTNIEDSVKAGKPEDEIKKQVLSLISALQQQVYNLKVLKIQRPAYRAVSGSAGAGGGAAAGGRKGGATQASEAEMEAYMLTLVNQHRSKVGLGALGPNSLLAGVAKAHSADMIKRNFFDHVNPDGRNPIDRANNAGWTAGCFENIAFTSNRGDGIATTEVADITLMNSPGHKANILRDNVNTCGIGIVYDATGGIRVTQMFAP